ncbi:MAG TPA: hypothetical protein VM370_09705 [Candidatus Thermoplasmatota archaeon]|nr:hypothetical protein [Candidatus Thermoplasmatota archaeon]
MGRQCVINNCWNAADEGTSVDAYVLLDDIEADILNPSQCSTSYQTQRWELTWGWVQTMDHNGIAEPDHWFAIGTSYQCWGGCAKWDNDEIVQHEISHNFNALDRGTYSWEGDGIMNYYDAWTGVTYWAQPDYNIVGNNMKNCYCYGSEE